MYEHFLLYTLLVWFEKARTMVWLLARGVFFLEFRHRNCYPEYRSVSMLILIQ